MKRITMNTFSRIAMALITLAFMFPGSACATGPRVTTALFSPDKDEIHAVDFPPFVSSDVAEGGVMAEVVRAALERGEVDVVITTHPVQRMVKYYLLQEHAIAGLGWHFQFSKEQKKDLIMIPIATLSEKYFYYKPTHPNGLKINANSMKGLRYGAHKGEDTTSFEKMGVEVQYGRTITLLKKLKRNELDFICSPPHTVEWLLDRYMSEEKDDFASTAGHNKGHEVFYIVFNRKHPKGEDAAGKFKKALNDISNDGTYGKIVEKHLGKGDSGKLYMRRLETLQ